MNQDAVKHKKDVGLSPRPNDYLYSSSLMLSRFPTRAVLITAQVHAILGLLTEPV